jgi:hypothetical protein
MSYLDDVFKQTVDGGYFDFSRCQRPDGTFYGTGGTCRKGDQVGAREQAKPAPKASKTSSVAQKPAKLGGVKVGSEKRLLALSVGQLKQLREDSRLYDYQKKKLDAIIAKKGGESTKPEPKAEKKDGNTREKHKADLLSRIKIQEESKYNKTLAEVDRSYKGMLAFIKQPGMDTPENRAAVTAMRALRMKMTYADIEKFRAKSKAKSEGLDTSPRYDKTPGSNKPIDPKKLGEKAKEYLELKKAADARQRQLDELKKLPWDERKKRGYQDIDDLHSTSLGAMTRLSRQRDFIELDKIYEAQGYNARPELVAKRSDLERRNDLVAHTDGKPLVLYRGVLSEEFADQFRGVGKDGGTHFAGKGIFGNGTYAASATPKGDDVQAKKTAKEYAGWGATPAMVTAFGIRKDANIVDFSKGDENRRYEDFAKWTNSIKDQASQKTGLPIEDIGHAAAIMGVHGYRVPQGDKEDYWVILNRGAIVAAADSQI